MNAIANQTVAEGSTADVAVSATDADGDALSYAWDFGDGSTGSGAQFRRRSCFSP